MFADAHCHLDLFDDNEMAAVLAMAQASGVEILVTVGTDYPSSAAGVAIADATDMVFAAVGLHPWLSQDYPNGPPLDEMRRLSAHGKVVAIGEIGLDFVGNSLLGLSYAEPGPRELQERIFREQLRLAKGLRLPVIVHSRGANRRVASILEEEGMEAVGGCIQFFEGRPEDVARYVDLGFTLSVGSSVTLPDPGHWHDTVRAIPTSSLVLESDAPWSPYLRRTSSRSEPADLLVIGGAIARVRAIDPKELFEVTTGNLIRALPLVERV